MPQQKAKDDEVSEGQVVPRNAAIVSTIPSTAAELDEYLRTQGEQETDPDGAAYERIIAQVLSATSAAVVLTPVEATQARDLVGVPFDYYGADFNKSEFDEGSPFYVSMRCIVAQDGTPLTVNCGHKKVIAQVVKLHEFGEYPYRVMFAQRGVSKKGNTPMLELVAVPPDSQEPAPF